MKHIHSFTNFMNGKFFKNSFQEHLVELADGTRIFLSDKDWKLHQKFHSKPELSHVFEEFRTIVISKQRQGGFYYDRQLNAFASYCLFLEQNPTITNDKTQEVVFNEEVLEVWALKYFQRQWMDKDSIRMVERMKMPSSSDSSVKPVKFCIGDL